MRTLFVAVLLASALLVPVAGATHADPEPCPGVVPGLFCTVDTAQEYCTGGVILSQCYGYTLVAALNIAYDACDGVFGPGRCPL